MHGALIAGQKLFLVVGDQHQFFQWEKCGFKLRVLQGTLSSPQVTCAVRVSALAGGHFILPSGTELVSAVYAITVAASTPILKKLILELQHCVAIENESQMSLLSFALAYPKRNEGGYSYQFEVIDGGDFSCDSEYGTIARTHFCYVAIVHQCDDDPGDSSSDDSSENNDQNEVSRVLW